ncbi:formate dehydrogenase subunit gamma [Actinocorallia longicatena]|uniref:Formate dehydrogenase subunit gamma n=1 Tax=Actinocorallia longicatena TaxID=111803 RepID=A0ABP6QH34_9ACTN
MSRLPRFSRGERAIHHLTALLMIVCLATALCLYFPPVSTAVGRRDLIKPIHIWAGYLLPLPMLLGWISRAFRDDLRRLNRFTPGDWEWMRRKDRRDTSGGVGIVEVGKFNAGQKLNAAFTAGAILVMLATGTIMTFPSPWPDDWRTGATFVHDWLFIGIFVVFLGHLWYAVRDRGALEGMTTGSVTPEWAAEHHSEWFREVNGQSPPARP